MDILSSLFVGSHHIDDQQTFATARELHSSSILSHFYTLGDQIVDLYMTSHLVIIM